MFIFTGNFKPKKTHTHTQKKKKKKTIFLTDKENYNKIS